MAKQLEASVWPLLERARVLRRDTSRLLKRLRTNSEEIKARERADDSKARREISKPPERSRAGKRK
jgi:hypothetical protein